MPEISLPQTFYRFKSLTAIPYLQWSRGIKIELKKKNKIQFVIFSSGWAAQVWLSVLLAWSRRRNLLSGMAPMWANPEAAQASSCQHGVLRQLSRAATLRHGSGCSSAWSDAVSSLKSAKAGSGTPEKWFIGGRESWHEHWVRGLGWNKVPPEVLLRLWCSWNRAPLFSVCKKLPCGVFVWVVKICLTQRADNEHLGAKPPLWKSFCCSSALASPANL